MRKQWVTILAAALVLAGCSTAKEGGPAPAGEARPSNLIPVLEEGEDFSPERFGKWVAHVDGVFSGIEGVYIRGRDDDAKQIVLYARTQETVERVEQARLQAGLPEHVIRVVAGPDLLSEREPLKGCELEDPPRPEPEGVWLELDPAPVRAGDSFAFNVAGVAADFGRVTRGIDSYLECWDGSAWSPRYILYAGIGDRQPSLELCGPAIIDAIGLGGPGPEHLVLPDSLEPGWYRLRKEVSVTGEDGSRVHEAFAFVRVSE